MGKEVLVSVVIPIYGVEKYIVKCAESLFKQTMHDGIEFIFVDDCTPDRSIELLEETVDKYPDRRSQVTIVDHEVNRGLAVARVTGLNAARGEYVIHCDSDDWVEPDMYEQMYLAAKRVDADIVGCDFYEEYPDRKTVTKQDFNIPHSDIVCEILKSKRIHGYLWNRMVRRTFYLDGDFRAPAGTTLYEDMAVTIPMHMATDRVAYLCRPLYHYNRTITDSMSTGMPERSLKSALSVLYFIKQGMSMEMDKDIGAVDDKFRAMALYYILTPEYYSPEKWMNLSGGMLPEECSLRARFTYFLVTHGMYKINRFLQIYLRILGVITRNIQAKI